MDIDLKFPLQISKLLQSSQSDSTQLDLSTFSMNPTKLKISDDDQGYMIVPALEMRQHQDKSRERTELPVTCITARNVSSKT